MQWGTLKVIDTNTQQTPLPMPSCGSSVTAQLSKLMDIFHFLHYFAFCSIRTVMTFSFLTHLFCLFNIILFVFLELFLLIPFYLVTKMLVSWCILYLTFFFSILSNLPGFLLLTLRSLNGLLETTVSAYMLCSSLCLGTRR